MSRDFVNQKTTDDTTYTAWRSVENGVCLEWVTCNGLESRCRLAEIWNDPVKLKGLFS